MMPFFQNHVYVYYVNDSDGLEIVSTFHLLSLSPGLGTEPGSHL